MKYNRLILLLVATLSANVYAAGSSGERELRIVKVVGGDYITIESNSTDFNNPDTCGNSSLAVIKQIDPGADKKLSLVLSAFMGGKKVGMWFDGCVSTPWGYTVPSVLSVYVVK